MAGYIFNLDSICSMKNYVENGIYSTILSNPDNYWKAHHEATLADYVTMSEGDNVYFFIKRKVYGIGELTNIYNDCKFLNFPQASIPKEFSYDEIREHLLWDELDNLPNNKTQRWLCIFKPAPYFFEKGVDMDEILESDPVAFKMLRAFWKVSFIKIDDTENQALKNILLKTNQDILNNRENGNGIFESNHSITHENLMRKVSSGKYNIDVSTILNYCNDEDKLKHEMALELGILNQLKNNDTETTSIFGNWDYLTHQVIASPFKPIDYMDKMDIFGYSYIAGYSPTKNKYLIIELKKDTAKNEDIDQLLKYVDWVKDEYCFGDYSMICAFLVTYDFDKDVINYKRDKANRKYTSGKRPAKTAEWNNLKLVKYSYNKDRGKIGFALID